MENTVMTGRMRTLGIYLSTACIALSGALSGVALLVPSATQAAGLSLDKLVTANQSSRSTTVTSPTFTTTQPNELLVAFLASDGNVGQAFSAVTNVTGPALTWTLFKRTNTQAGTAEIWTATAPSVLTGASVRGTHAGSYQASITVATFIGAELTVKGASGGGNALTGAPTAALTTTRAGSWVWGVGNDWDKAVARTVGSNQTKTSEYLAPDGDTFWSQRQNAVTPTAGTSVTVNDTAPTTDRWNLSLIEVIPAVVDTTAPSVPAGLAATAPSPLRVDLTWLPSTDDTGVAGYRVYRDGALMGTAVGTTYTDSTVSPNTGYSYTVRAYDGTGNVSADSIAATVTTPLADTTAPTISTVGATAITQTAATIGWTTDEASDSQVEYGLSAGYGSSTTLASALVTTHAQGLSGLTAATPYHYRVKSKDASGNLAVSGDNIFTTAAPAPDTTPPTTAITSPANNSTVSATISVTANASDNVGVIGVQFKLDGNLLGAEDTASPFLTSWNTTAATNGTHVLTSVARDAAGNTTSSAPITVTVSNGTGGGTPLTVNGATTYQTMTGLGASINTDSWGNGALKPVIDQLIDVNGTKTFRVVMEMMDWEGTNDDADPSNFNWSYYDPIYSGATTFDTAQSGSNFGNLWNTIDYLHARGIPDSQIILSFMGPGPSWLSGSKTNMAASQEDEFVETVLSAAYWGYSHGHTFGVFSPDNEADLVNNQEGIVMASDVYAASMNKLAQRMDALGMGSVRLLGPETSGANSGYINAMAAYSGLLAKVDHFDFHNYSGSTNNAQSIVSGTGKDFWVSEYSIFDQSFNLLGENAPGLLMWDAYDSVYNHAILNGLGSAPGNDAGNAPAWIAYDAGAKTYTPRKSFYQFAQLFKYLPLGSVRVSSAESNSNVTTMAFTDPVSHRVTIVGQNTGVSNVAFSGTLANLPNVPAFELYTTDNTVNMQRGSDVTVTGGAFNFTAPANGVFTLTYAPPADSVAPTVPTNLAATSTAPGKADLSWSASTDNVGVTGYNVYRSATPGFVAGPATKIGTSATPAFTDLAPAGTYYYQVLATDASGNLSSSSGEVSVSVLADTDAPTAPSSLVATAVNGGQVDLAWTAATDNVSVSQYNITRNGSVIASTAGATFSDTTTAVNTTYTYAVTAQDPSGNIGPASNSATVTTPASRPVALDTTVSFHQISAAPTIATPGITTTAPGELLVAFVGSDGPSGSGTQSFSSVVGGGLTWAMRQRTNTQAGTSEIWTAVATSALSNAPITATRSNGAYVGSIVVAAFQNANLATIGHTVSASAATGAPSASLTLSNAGSWVWGVGNDWDAAVTRTVGSGQTKVDEFLASVGDTFWVQRQAAGGGTVGSTVTLNDTAPTGDRWNFAAIEILPAP